MRTLTSLTACTPPNHLPMPVSSMSGADAPGAVRVAMCLSGVLSFELVDVGLGDGALVREGSRDVDAAAALTGGQRLGHHLHRDRALGGRRVEQLAVQDARLDVRDGDRAAAGADDVNLALLAGLGYCRC